VGRSFVGFIGSMGLWDGFYSHIFMQSSVTQTETLLSRLAKYLSRIFAYIFHSHAIFIYYIC